jgi:hypothetical protein
MKEIQLTDISMILLLRQLLIEKLPRNTLESSLVFKFPLRFPDPGRVRLKSQ